MITIKRRDNQLKKRGLLCTGNHRVIIEQISECFAPEKTGMPWDDRTPQLAIRFKNNEGYVTLWHNTVGYMTRDMYTSIPDGVVFKQHPFSGVWYAVDVQTNARIISPEKSRIAYAMLCRLAYCCGVKEDQKVPIMDLVGRELIIKVQELNGYPKVTNFY